MLASGIAVPIASLKPGDMVLATNTKTGKTQAEPITAVLLHHDTDLYDLRIRTAHGTVVIQTTSSHLFWDPTTRQWYSFTIAMSPGCRAFMPIIPISRTL